MRFKFELRQIVKICISGETGHVKGRCEYVSDVRSYLIHYKSSNGHAVSGWFDEEDLIAVDDKRNPEEPVFWRK